MNDAPLIAEEFLLCVADADGRTTVGRNQAAYGAAAALFTELALSGRIAVSDGGTPDVHGRQVKKGRLMVTAGAAPADPELRRALEIAAGQTKKDKHSAPSAARALEQAAGGLPRRLLDRMVVAGLVEDRRSGRFWLRRSHTVVDDRPAAEIRSRLAQALVAGAPADRRTSALISVLWAVGAAPNALPDSDPKQVAKQAKRIASDDPFAKAAHTLVTSLEAAKL